MGVMSIRIYLLELSRHAGRGIKGGACVLVTTPPNRQRMLSHNWRGRHQIAKAQAGSLLDLGLGGRVLPISGCQRHTEPDLSYEQHDDGQTKHGGPDSKDAANEVVCFHGPTLVPCRPKVLIERIERLIDGSDEGSNTALRSHTEVTVWGLTRAG